MSERDRHLREEIVREHEPVPPRAGAIEPGAAAILRLQAGAGNQAVTRMLQREGLVHDAVEWVKGKLTPEKELDGQLKQGLERTAKVFKLAEAAIGTQPLTPASLAQSHAYAELAGKFEAAAAQAGKIIGLKDNLILLGEFKSALEAADEVDLARDGAAGAEKLFTLMAVGGKIGRKVFPPPFDAYFDLASQMSGLENVAKAWDPERQGGPHSDQVNQTGR